MAKVNRRAALRAVQAAAGDIEGKLGVGERPEPAPAPALVEAPEPPEIEPEPAASGPVETVSEIRTAFESEPQPAPPPATRRAPAAQPREPELEDLLPDEWRERVAQAAEAEAVEVHGERVRRRVEEETVYLAVRVPRSLRDAIRRRAERLDVSIQEFVIRAAGLLLDATARAAEHD